jgi:DNA-binding MarR family transcriptional regulator
MVDRHQDRRTRVHQIEELIAALAMATSPIAGPERWLELDLTMAQVKTLMVVRYHGFTRIGRVARDLGLSANAATAAVDHLEAAGLAERRPDPSDRRAVLVGTTEAGERFVLDLMTAGVRAFNEHIERLADADLDALHRGLEALFEAVAGEATLDIQTTPATATGRP